MAHADMVRRGAEKYVQSLRAGRLVGHAGAAADRIIESIETADRLGASLNAADVPFTHADLHGLTNAERAALRNPFLPGYGDPDAQLVLVGTEHAFDFERPRPRGPSPEACFATADCGLHMFWLADGGETACSLAEHVSGKAAHCRRALALHRHPYEYLYPVPSGHMWRRLSRMMRAAGLSLDRCAAQMWGESAYMFELSETAAADQVHGALPSSERIAFHSTILSALPSARVLVFHGRWNEGAWDAIRLPLASAFLDEPRPVWVTSASGDARSSTSVDGEKLVVLMQSPTRRGPTNDFLDEVGTIIGPYLGA